MSNGQAKNKRKKSNYKWILWITTITFVISLSLSFISNTIAKDFSMGGALTILLFFIVLGIFCDIIGLAIATADVIPYHSMASQHIRGAKQAIYLSKHASAFSNFFNDVIGDICGIISGSMIGVILLKIVIENENMIYILFSAFVAAVTVGGKACGKSFALKNANQIVYKLGVITSYFKKEN